MSEGAAELDQLVQKLKNEGYPILALADNEMAKIHIRYMVGGHAPGVDDEVVYRFEFPERPGALLNFLTQIGTRWNISLFHYRNHGAAYGRVLVGLQVALAERKELKTFFDNLGYQWWEETDNPAYKLFLS